MGPPILIQDDIDIEKTLDYNKKQWIKSQNDKRYYKVASLTRQKELKGRICGESSEYPWWLYFVLSVIIASIMVFLIFAITSRRRYFTNVATLPIIGRVFYRQTMALTVLVVIFILSVILSTMVYVSQSKRCVRIYYQITKLE